MAEMKQYNWATLGTGVIANELAQALESQGESFTQLPIGPMIKA